MLGSAAWLAVLAAPVEGQAAAAQGSATPASGVVAVELAGTVDPPVDDGVLVRTSRSTLAPTMAVYVGLSVVGATLALVTARRRAFAVRSAELTTGIDAGRRSLSDFWDVPVSSEAFSRPVRRGLPRFGFILGSGLPLLVVSGDTAPIAEHRPSVRAGFAEGANDG